MGKTPGTFLVDTASDPREVRKAVRGLRAMSKLGRLAEKALAELAENGHFDSRAPWLSPTTYSKKYLIKYSRFPSIPSMSREDVPGYGPLRVSVGKQPFSRIYGSVRHNCLDVTVLVATPIPAGQLVEKEVHVGHVKLNSNNNSFYPSHHDEKARSRSIVLLRGVKPYYVRHVAKVLAEAAAGPEFEKEPVPAVYYGRLSQWLVEDGHAHQFLVDLRNLVDDYETVLDVIHG